MNMAEGYVGPRYHKLAREQHRVNRLRPFAGQQQYSSPAVPPQSATYSRHDMFVSFCALC